MHAPTILTAISFCRVTQDDIHSDPNSTINGLDAWADKGIAGRGIFIDYFDWAQERGIQYDALTNHPIPIEHVKQIIAEKHITTRQGDICFLRTGMSPRFETADIRQIENTYCFIPGYVQAYAKLSPPEREALSQRRGSTGLGQGKEATEWLWESQFAAVVAANVAFECSRKSFSSTSTQELQADEIAPVDPSYHLHPILLSGWGTPIGELFDLELLSATCKKLNRWAFFVTSAPLNYTGAVASPPNAIAIF